MRCWGIRGAALAGLLALLVMALGQGPADAVAPPVRGLSPEQRARLKERDRWLALARKHARAGKLLEAIKAAENMLAVERAVFGDVHEEVADSQILLARLHEARGDYAAVAKARAEVVTIREKMHGAGHWRAVDARWQLATALRLAKAAPEQRRAYQRARQLNEAAMHLQGRGKPAEALKLALEARGLFKASLGEKHPDYATWLNNLAALYRDMGDHARALPLFKEARDVYKAALGEEHPHYAYGLNNLANLYQDRGEHARALPLFEQARGILKTSFGEEHPAYAASLNNLAMLYRDMGGHAKALALLKQARDLSKASLGETHPRYAASLNNLGMLYRDMGDHAKALALYERARDITKAVLGEEHPHYAASLNNLANLYQRMGDHARALPPYEQARDITKATLGKEHPDYAASLDNLALRYGGMGDHARALALLEQARDITKARLGGRHPDYANCLSGMALVYQAMGDHAKALPLSEQARGIIKAALGEKHPHYATSLNNLAALHQARGEWRAARRCSEQSLSLTRERIEVNASLLSERQQLAEAASLKHHLDLLLSLQQSAERLPATYAHVLALKGAVLDRQQRSRFLRQAALREGGAGVKRLAAELTNTASQLSALSRLAPATDEGRADRLKRLAELTADRERQEVELARLSADFRRLRQRERLTPAQLQKALPKGAVLVDLLEYGHYKPGPGGKGLVAQRRLAAFVVRPDALVRLDLGRADVVAEQIDRWRLAVRRGYRPDGRGNGPGERLRELLWEPLLPHLKGARTVLVSPDGATTRLPFAALPGSRPGSYLLEEIDLAVVPVPQLLPELLARAKAIGPASLLLVGDVYYGPAKSKRTGAVLGGWQALPGTRAEAAALAGLFRKHNPKGALTALRGPGADLPAVRAQVAKHSHLHLATHGFFAPPELRSALAPRQAAGLATLGPDPFGGEAVSGWLPGLLSGIVLAGANRQRLPGRDDGILTALEVAELDLGRCELAVLSACETGLGETAGGEGLLGLQRAFQAAGARAVVASLWQVPDEATRALMTRFYANLWSGKHTRLGALLEAQRWLLKEGRKDAVLRAAAARSAAPPGWGADLPPVRSLRDLRSAEREDGVWLGPEGGPLPPLFWAAFVLSGDWR
jgi:CHAT domain-containing protein